MSDLNYQETNRLCTEFDRLISKNKQSEAECIALRYQVKTIKEDMKYYLENNEENGVVFIPKFVVEKIISR